MPQTIDQWLFLLVPIAFVAFLCATAAEVIKLWLKIEDEKIEQARADRDLVARETSKAWQTLLTDPRFKVVITQSDGSTDAVGQESSNTEVGG